MNLSLNAIKLPLGLSAQATAQAAPPQRAAKFGATVWRFLENIGRSRARRELLLLADQWELTRPDLAAQLRETARWQDAA